MAHGSKRWIVAVDRQLQRRLKRSRHRTADDALGPLVWSARRWWRDDCPACAAEGAYYEANAQPPRWRVAAVYVCRGCREARQLERRIRGGNVWLRSGVPRWFRRQLEQEYRARVRHIMAEARYDDTRYDALPPTRRKDAAWLYW